MAKRVLPRVHVLVVCDAVDDHSEEVAAYDLIHVRSHILAPSFPYCHPHLPVYLQVTGHERTVRCRTVLLRADTDEELYVSSVAMVSLAGPLDFYHIHFPFPDCEFPAAGIYYLQVYFDEILCGERALILVAQETGSNGQAT